jgi:hypothetical protein
MRNKNILRQETAQCLVNITQTGRFIEDWRRKWFYVRILLYEICVTKLSNNKYLENITIIRKTVLLRRILGMEYWTERMDTSCPLCYIAERKRRRFTKILNSFNLHEDYSCRKQTGNALARAQWSPVKASGPFLRLCSTGSEIPSYGKGEKASGQTIRLGAVSMTTEINHRCFPKQN